MRMTKPRNSALEQALRLAKEPSDQSISLALLLAELRPLTEFIRRSGISRRKAYYLAEVGRKLNGVEADRKRLVRIGWTKLQLVAKEITSRNARELIGLAEDLSANELKRAMRGQEPRERTRCTILYFDMDAHAEVEQALIEHGAVPSGRGLVGREEALLKIIRESK